MGLFKTIIGGAIGFAVAGPVGAAGGAVIANTIGNKEEEKNTVNCPHCNKKLFVDGPGLWNCCDCKGSFEYTIDNKIIKYFPEEYTEMFLIFAAFSKFCKINGVIKHEHIEAVTDIMSNNFGLNKEDKALAIKYFRVGRDSDKTFEDYCIELNNNYDDNIEEDKYMKSEFLTCLYKLATCCGKISYEEEKVLNYTAAIMKIDPYFIDRLKEEYVDNSIDKYYEILGCKKGDSMSVIKSKYRKIVSECHPDRIVSKDLPDYLVQYSTQRFREVQEAYEKIKLTLQV